jgi:hypothetical protein
MKTVISNGKIKNDLSPDNHELTNEIDISFVYTLDRVKRIGPVMISDMK